MCDFWGFVLGGGGDHRVYRIFKYSAYRHTSGGAKQRFFGSEICLRGDMRVYKDR